MTELIDMSATVALDRLAAWKIALRAENKSPGTVTIYADCVSRYLRWCAEHDNRPMSRACLNQWVAGMLDAGAAPGTARIRQQACRRFAAWLTAGGELPVDPFPGMKAPRVQPPLVEPLTDAELRALLDTCTVPQDPAPVGERLHHRRDDAIIRLMFETAIRSGEPIGLSLDDLDLIGRLITIRRGKGGPGRTIPIGQATTEALLAYLIDWAKHATDFGRGHQSLKASADWCRLLAEHRPDDLLDARMLVFRRWPSSTTAAHLDKDAGTAWPDHRDEVLATLAASPRDAVLFALLTLKDIKFAWNLAHALALDSNDVWERLTKEYEKVDPLAVLPILTKLVEDELTEAGAQHYRNSARRLKRMRQLVTGSDEAAEVDDLIAELRETHRRRPRLQQEFERAGLP